ncbi:hypothetical protein F5Y04DRAFT_240593 [Hypomontagnella monticulosa]|nr:hypothetical protein F5Y04DRAFT_240593 [Hypomontagnella monticulosa]
MDRFAYLPTELRYYIWDHALRREARDRLLVVCRTRGSHSNHLFPLRRHASPLLSVSYESRCRALEFYSLKLKVYSAELIQYPDRWYHYHFRTTSVTTGYMYVNPQWDYFIGIESTDIVSNLRASLRGLRHTPQPDWDVLRPYVTDAIAPAMTFSRLR